MPADTGAPSFHAETVIVLADLAARVAQLEDAFRAMCTAEQILARAGYPEQAPPPRRRHLHLVKDTPGERTPPAPRPPPGVTPHGHQPAEGR